MTTTTEARRRPAAPDAKSGALGALLAALDGAGLGGQLTEARALLARAEAVGREHREGVARATAQRNALTAAVADGTLTFTDAAQQSAVLAPWLEVAADALLTPVVVELRNRAMQAARADALTVHKALAGCAALAVKRGVEAGKRLVDVRRIAAILTPPKWTPPPEGYGQHFRNDPSKQHPWLASPPVLPTLDFGDIQGDPARVSAWADASTAYADFLAVHQVAEVLHGVTGGSSTMFGNNVDRNGLDFLTGGLPEVVHLAVADALGWRPGLHMSLRSAVAPPVDTDKTAGWAPPAVQQAARRWLVGG